jgi:hypothetical protein
MQRVGMSGSGAGLTRVCCAGPDNGLVVDVEPGRFEEMVITALDGLPEDLGQLMRNVAVTMAPGRLACSGSTRASR